MSRGMIHPAVGPEPIQDVPSSHRPTGGGTRRAGMKHGGDGRKGRHRRAMGWLSADFANPGGLDSSKPFANATMTPDGGICRSRSAEET